MSKNRLLDINSDILNKIFEYDPTYYEIFSTKVLPELQLHETKLMFNLFTKNWGEQIISNRISINYFTCVIKCDYSIWGDNICIVRWEKLNNKRVKFIVYNHNMCLEENIIFDY